MMGGGVAALIQGDEFTGLLHTPEHFAPGFVVIAGGVQDVLDGTGIGTRTQEVQDGLALRRADGTGAQATELGGIGCRKPGEDGKILLGEGDGVGEDGWCCAQRVFGGQQQAVAFVGGIGSEQQMAAGGGEDGRGGTVWMEGIGGSTREGAGEHDGAVGALGEVDESRQGTTPARDGSERVQDE